MSSIDAAAQLVTLVDEFMRKQTGAFGAVQPECELKFGTRGVRPITKINFDNVICRLLSAGFTIAAARPNSMLRATPQYVDAKTGMTKLSNVRCEIAGLSQVQRYCRNNTLPVLGDGTQQARFVQKTMIREADGGVPIANPVDFDDFNFRVTLHNETTLDPNKSPLARGTIDAWRESKKVFRYITRTTMRHPTLPIVADLSVVKESNRRGPRLVPEYSVADSGVFDNREKYEIELEVDAASLGFGPGDRDAGPIAASLRRAALIVLKGLQETNFPVSYPEQSAALDGYIQLFDPSHKGGMRVFPRQFIGPNPTTLQAVNAAPVNPDSNIPNIRQQYTVTEKADGARKLLYIDGRGKIYLISTNMNVQFTGARTAIEEYRHTLLDGEHVLHNKKGEFINLYAAFDVYFINKQDVRSLPLVPLSDDVDPLASARLPKLIALIKQLGSSGIKPGSLPPIRITNKRFYVDTPAQSIFQGCGVIMQQEKDGMYEYETDGLIFTPARLGVGASKQGDVPRNFKSGWEYAFKWKPAHLNTIDFLVSTEKTSSGQDAIKSVFQSGTDAAASEQLTQYQTLVLRVGFDEKKHGYLNPCAAVINDVIPQFNESGRSDNYRPMQFFPTNPYDAEAGLCNVLLREDSAGAHKMFTEGGEVFEDGTIVEFSYDPSKEGRWRWVPLRVRYDKTAEYRGGGKNYGNAYHVANTNWHSLHNPVTEEMITVGTGIPDELADDDIYYNRAVGSTSTRGLRDFHNLYVKKRLIVGVSRPGNTLIDYAVGKGGDMPKWIAAKLSFVFGVDLSKDNIENRLDGACARYLNYRTKFKEMPFALYAYGNGSINFRDGDGLFGETGKRVARAVFGEGVRDEKELGKGVARQFGKGKSGFNVSSVQFAVHYMFRDAATVHGFLRNVSECTKAGGYFIGTTYDGQQIFNMLRGKKDNESVSIEERGAKLWEITKRYDRDDFEANSSCVGYAIDVYQESINKTFREFLVNFDYLTRMLEDYGFVPATRDEARKMGLGGAIGSFRELYGQMEQDAKRNRIASDEYGTALKMTPAEKRISFLNKYFVYKKVRDVNAEKVSQTLQNTLQSEVQEEARATADAVATVSEVQEVAAPVVRRTRRKLVLKGT